MAKSFTAQLEGFTKLTKRDVRYVAAHSIQDVVEGAQTSQRGISKGATSFEVGKIPVADADLVNSLDSEGKDRRSKEDTVDPQNQLSEAASRFVVGFEGVERHDPDTDKLRPLTTSPEDLAWFFHLNMISMSNLMRGDGSGITQSKDETDEAFDWRHESEMGKWLKPSFSQQVIDFAREDDIFLGRAGQGRAGQGRDRLKLYAHQLGFLHSTPKDWKQTRLGLLVQQAKKAQEQVETGLPELPAGQYIVDAMMVMGPTRSNGMGEAPTDWDVILPFVTTTGDCLKVGRLKRWPICVGSIRTVRRRVRTRCAFHRPRGARPQAVA